MNRKMWRINSYIEAALLLGIIALTFVVGDCTQGDAPVSGKPICRPAYTVAAIFAAIAFLSALFQSFLIYSSSKPRRIALGVTMACLVFIILAITVFPGICDDPVAHCHLTQALITSVCVLVFLLTSVMMVGARERD